MLYEYSTLDNDIAVLRNAGMAEADIAHCKKVSEKALEVANRISLNLNLQVIARGALFHDLGKSQTHEITHGKIGAEIGRGLGLPQELLDIMEKHIRGGMTPEEAAELGLPSRDYKLNTLEERIVIYADRLVDIITDGIVQIESENEAEEKFEEILTSVPKYGKNEPTLKRYLGYHREIQSLIAKRQS